MKRLGLLVALGFSLWPVVFIGWVFLAPHSETSSQQAVTTQTTKTAAPTAKDDSWKGRSIGGSSPVSPTQSPRTSGWFQPSFENGGLWRLGECACCRT